MFSLILSLRQDTQLLPSRMAIQGECTEHSFRGRNLAVLRRESARTLPEEVLLSTTSGLFT